MRWALAQLLCALAAAVGPGGTGGGGILLARATVAEPTDARRQLQLQVVDCVGAWSICYRNCTRTFTVTTEQANGGSACEHAHNSVHDCLGSGECRYFELPDGLPTSDGAAYVQHSRVPSNNPAFDEARCSVAVVAGDFGGPGSAQDIYVINRYCGAWDRTKNHLLLHDPMGMPGLYGEYSVHFGEDIVDDQDDSRGAVVADFDGDGRDDIFVVNYFQRNKLYLQNNPIPGTKFESVQGTGTAATAHLDHTGPSTAVVTGDFDGDGVALDMYITNYGQRNEMYISSGDLAYEYTSISSGDAVACCTFDGYCHDQSWQASATSMYIVRYTEAQCADAGYTWTPAESCSGTNAIPCTKSRDVVVLDWMGESRPPSTGIGSSTADLFVLNGDEASFPKSPPRTGRTQLSEHCQVFLNDGSGVYTVFEPGSTLHPLHLDVAIGYSGAYKGDFNGDVEGYLSAAGSASMGAPNQMWLTNGAGAYSAVTFTDIVTDVAVSHGAVVGDFDGNGDTNDIYVLNAPHGYIQGHPDQVQLYLTDGNGTYRAMPAGEALKSTDRTENRPPAPETLGGNPHAAVLGDFTGTRTGTGATVLDIFIANYDSSGHTQADNDGQRNSLLRGQEPTPTFELVQKRTTTGAKTPDIVANNAASNAVVVGDFDCGGRKNDIYILNEGTGDGKGGNNELLLWNDTAQGGYTAVAAVGPSGINPAVTSSGESRGGCVGDFNDDGKDDIFVVNWLDRNEILLNQCDGMGTFSSSVSVPCEDVHCSTAYGKTCAVGDFNGDGKADDIFVVTNAPDDVSPVRNQILLNDGSGEFTEWHSSAVAGDCTTNDAIESLEDSVEVLIGDFNNDGNANDIYVINGWAQVGNEMWFASDSHPGCYTEGTDAAAGASTTTATVETKTGGCVGDFNDDGNANDIYITTKAGPNEMFIASDSGDYSRVADDNPEAAIAVNDIVTNEQSAVTCLVGAFGGDLGSKDIYVVGPGGMDGDQVHTMHIRDGGGVNNRWYLCKGCSDQDPPPKYADALNRKHLFNGGTGAVSTGGALLDFDGNGVANEVIISTKHVPSNLLVYSLCLGHDGPYVGDGYVARGSICYPCPPYSIGTMSPTLCKYCPGGKVGPLESDGETPTRGWDHDQEYACSPCAAGKYRGTFDQTDTCTNCPAGRYAGKGASKCELCDSGRVTADEAGEPTDMGGAVQCVRCRAGQGPADQTPGLSSTNCESCVGRNVSNDGQCKTCEKGKIADSAHITCIECPVGQRPHASGMSCICDMHHFNSSAGLIFCFDGDYHSDKLDSEAYSTMRVQHNAGQECLQCPACVQCDAGAAPALLPGWSLSPKGLDIWAGGLDVPAPGLSPRSAFRCAVDGEVCAANVAARSSTSSARNSRRLASKARLNGQCTDGHEGSLCGVCAPDWKGSFGELCEPCTPSDWRVPAVGLLILLALVACLYARIQKKAEEMQGRLDSIRAKYVLARTAVVQARKILSEQEEAMDDIDDEEGAFQATLDTIKIVISNLQIIAQLPVTLKFTCPLCENMKQMMGILPAINLDALQSFSIDCFVTVGLHQRFIYNLIGPGAVIACVALWGRTGRSKVQVLEAGDVGLAAHHHDRSSKANQIILLIIFLVYPSVSTTIFSVFSCRTLDFAQSVHVYDASINCNSTEYKALFVMALVALVLVPIGVPVGFAYVLFKNRSRLGTRPEDTISFEVFCATARSILKDASLTHDDLCRAYDLIDVDNSGEVSSAELWRSALKTALSSTSASNSQVEDCWHEHNTEELRGSESAAAPFEHRSGITVPKTRWWEGGPEEYRFLVRAYEPRYFWYELVHYGKKFVLSGVLVFAGPGSTAQLYVGLIVSFYFFALLSRCTPYKNSKTDRTAVIAEANLFFTLLCLLMLKINLTGEWLRRDFYDTALVGSNVVVALAPTAIAVVMGLHRLASEWADSASDPLAKGDRARILDCPKSLRSCGHVATVLSSTDTTITVRVQICASSSRKGLSLATCRRNFFCCPGTAAEVLEHELAREQLQLILGRKQFLRLCAGMCKQLLLCWRARSVLDSATDSKEDIFGDSKEKDDGTADDTGGTAHEVISVEDVEACDDLDDISLKEEALNALRSVCEPALVRRGTTWEHAKNVIAKLSSLSELQHAIEEPDAFVSTLWQLLEPVIKDAALAKLRPHAEPELEKHGVAWEHARQVLSMVTSISRLHAAVEDPDAFVSELQSASAPAAKAFAIAKLRPVLQPMLAQHAPSVTWEQMVAVLGAADTTVEYLGVALDDPVDFFERLLRDHNTPVARRFLIAKLRPVLEPLLKPAAAWLDWDGILPILELIDSVEDVEAALSDPNAFLESLLSAASPYAKQMVILQLRPVLQPLITTRVGSQPRQGDHVVQDTNWGRVVLVLDGLAEDVLREGVADPEALLERVWAQV